MSRITTIPPLAVVAGKKTRFVVYYKETILSVKAADVSYFTAENGSVQLFTLTGKGYTIRKNLTELEEQLDEHQFFRVNRSTIISFDGIDRVETFFGQRAIIFLKPSGKVVVPKGRLTAFLNWLDQ